VALTRACCCDGRSRSTGPPTAGVYGGTVDIVFSVAGRGTAWLAGLRPHDPVDVVGPLGTPFALPTAPASCVLVGGGYGSAPLFSLAESLLARGCRVDMVLGAATEQRLFGVLEARRVATTLTVTTDDGSTGIRGRVSDVLPAVMRRGASDVVYACGPMGMLAAVSAIGDEAGVPAQTAVEESMACGIGVCMTCVLPVVGPTGSPAWPGPVSRDRSSTAAGCAGPMSERFPPTRGARRR
jgi:dihydroorotate dehydrogenase electron transfer subunit